MILLVGFTIMSNNEGKILEPVNTENINAVNSNENSTVNNSIINYINKGIMTASWYGPRFHGRLTANGEIYNQMALTAASKTMKFGTLLKITNLKNKKSVIVRINDRGPYIKGRQLDLSKGAAIKLGMIPKGVIKIKVEQLTLKGVNFPVITLN
ncbi:MAG TPA: septal ring lytic transglycosylase RlpA family protein [Ignavibacteria bacterium]|nr:septal ring lytic transglycosylase RlpA family protein [Ignavibacteria bacterium]